MKKKVIVLGTHDPTLGRRLAEQVAKLRLSDVTESVCDNCEPVSGFYLGMTCPKCNRPFRSVKQTVR
jgi:ribosomal protein L37AE/L43A